jgi:FKBP-type peptidyl-prolyl cis-trans isomerase
MSHRRNAALVLAALSLVLTACGDEKDDAAGKDDAAAGKPASCKAVAGDTSKSVDVEGTFGKKQTATFESPLKADELQHTLVTEGDGDYPQDGDELDVLVTIYSGTTGKSLGSQNAALTVGDEQILEAFRTGVDCVPVGSRSVITVPVSEVYGEQGNPSVGLVADDVLVIVTDVIGEKEQLKPADWTDNPPTVTFDDQGKPSLELPAGKPEKELLLKVLEPGDGDVVGKGDSVTLDYQGTSWDTGKIFDQSYGRGAATFTTDGVVPGFGAALVGQKVGTRLVVTIPPEHAYGAAGSGHELSGQTLVFVVYIKETKAS